MIEMITKRVSSGNGYGWTRPDRKHAEHVKRRQHAVRRQFFVFFRRQADDEWRP